MPTYSLKCSSCKTLSERFVRSYSELSQLHCEKCKCKQLEVVPSRISVIFPKGGRTLTNVAAKPVHFSSLGKMKKYAKEHNLELGALL